MLAVARILLQVPLYFLLILLFVFPSYANESCKDGSSHFTSKKLIATSFTEDDLQIVVLKVGAVPVAPDLEIYANESQILVPINALIEVLSMDMSYLPVQNKVQGKLLSTECTFELSLSGDTATTNTKAVDSAKWHWYQDDFDTYKIGRAHV